MYSRHMLLRTVSQTNKSVNVTSVPVARFYREQKCQSKCPREPKKEKFKHFEKVLAAALIGSVVLAKYYNDKTDRRRSSGGFGPSKSCGGGDHQKSVKAGEKVPGLPTYRAEEVAKHNTEDDAWVIFRHGVYDITKYVKYHPGAEQILGAAGSSVEPFWNLMTDVHHNSRAYKVTESLRIGNLHDDDVVDYTDEEHWANEPQRDPRLSVNLVRPFNAEVPQELLHDHFYTPSELFYRRIHMAVPDLDENTHTFKVNIVKGKCTTTKEFSLKDLQRLFETREVKAALQCSVNRRNHMTREVQPINGVDWKHGAISNAVWCGVSLVDVLEYCGLDMDNIEGLHCLFEGHDIDAQGLPFSASIPLHQALNPNGMVMLATRMNGKPLLRDHGYPIRALVPGAPGFRSVKWLVAITISTEESPSFWHLKDYRGHNPSRTWDTVDFPKAKPIYRMPVTSAFSVPKDGDVVEVKNGCIEVKGYAYSGGGNMIQRVDVSPDQGNTWIEAQELQQTNEPPTRHYTWTLWKAYIPVQPGQKEMYLWVKATDSNFNTQPEKFRDIWNIRALLSHAYHKIKVEIKQ